MSRSVTSYMPTGTATVTRNQDRCVFPYAARPQALTLYARWQVRLIQSYTTQSFVIVQLGSTAGTNPRCFLGGANGGEIAFVNVSSTGGSATAVVNPAISLGQIAEARGMLYSDGSAQIGVSLNGGAETVSAKVAGKVLPPTWAVQKLMFGGLNNVAIGLQNVRIARGNQSLATMRRLAGLQTV